MILIFEMLMGVSVINNKIKSEPCLPTFVHNKPNKPNKPNKTF